jgi:Uma2 family endonuclease
MAPSRGKKPATYDDILALPDNVVGQLLGGELFVSPRPALRHSNAHSVVGFTLGVFHRRGGGDGPGGWWILDEPELHLHGDVLVPDLAGYRRERVPTLPGDTVRFELPPDWVCEVLSPSTSRIDRTLKRAIYHREEVPYLWLIDPRDRTLEVMRRDPQGGWHVDVYSAGDTGVRAQPFEAIELDLERLWEDVERAPESD